jgi:hypothetical protein
VIYFRTHFKKTGNVFYISVEQGKNAEYRIYNLGLKYNRGLSQKIGFLLF